MAKEVLEEPVPAWTTLQNLGILESHFVGGLLPETDWSVALDVSTQFLDQLRWYDVPALAEAISREDMAMFQEYVRLVFTTEGDQARAILCARWNQLKVTIWECIAAEIGLESTIDGLAHALHELRNYYSLSAVVEGIQANDLKTRSSHKYTRLVDPANDHEIYRSGVENQPALPCVLSALAAFERGNPTCTSGSKDFDGYAEHFPDLVRGMRAKLETAVGASGRIDPIPVSGESGGYGSVSKILDACFRD
ncbi:hypothetical protein N7450_011411 [Penicillium hetheringtonii]|uniref:Uncharacterized protein n=1 Tax=Penicillium hetheringtonii TaxID=911720 RepID=A0AAD6GNA1_9EURO|nr:hypothetical protein N7450_011411 [Penicillium hetheringtonii]